MNNDDFSVPMVPKIHLFTSAQLLAQRPPEVDALPETTKETPFEVLHRFSPTIARRVASFWGEPELVTYLSNIMVMDRQGRAGFPSGVMAALMAIRQSTKDPVLQESPWEGSADLEKAFKKSEQEIRRSRMGSRVSAADAALLDMAALRPQPPAR